MATIISCLIVCLGTVVALGLTAAAEDIERSVADKQGMSSPKLLSKLYSALDLIKSKSLSAYNDTLDKMSRVPNIESVGALKQYLIEAQRKKVKVAKDKRDLATTIEQTAAGYQTELMNFANQPDSWKTSDAGKRQLADIEERQTKSSQEAEKRLEEINNYEKTI